MTSTPRSRLESIRSLLSMDGFADLVLEGIDRGELPARRFRHVAATALMVLRNPEPGRRVRVGGLNWVSTRLYPMIKSACPDHPLLRETRREVLEDVLDVPAATRWLTTQPPIRFRNLPELSPFAAAWIEPGGPDLLRFEPPAEALRRLHSRLVGGRPCKTGVRLHDCRDDSPRSLPAMKHPNLPIFEGWRFTPEGAAVHHAERTAVIADLHLGYEWARGASGDCVVAHSLEETLTRLSTLLGRSMVSQLIVAGDLSNRLALALTRLATSTRLKSWLADRGVSFLVLEGNHDVAFSLSARRPSGASNRLPATCSVAGWTIGHGHQPIPGASASPGIIIPVFRWQGIAAPCFVVSTDRIVLPAFSPNAAGCDVITSALPKDWRAGSLRCLVSTGDEVLDFGPLAGLRRKLRHRVT